jgi:glycosyltransferase involved in cell wall biosynthesis
MVRAQLPKFPVFKVNQADMHLDRPQVRGKFIFIGEEKFWVRGVTYGAFQPNADGDEYQNLELIERDFAQMAANGINTVRIPHTMPPRSLLDIAQRQGLKVMVGLSMEQYVGYLIDKKDAPDVEKIVRAKVKSCAGHPALLCYALGNEIQAPVVRWIGRHKVERYLERIYRAVKAEDPGGIVTYVNYPTTEYLDLHYLDMLCFNVYLEAKEHLEPYLARLQNIAGERPLLMGEVGLDSLRNGEETQARVLEWQIRSTFESGCAGACIFSWTDEWYRAEEEVQDWAFGLTRKNRQPKPALEVVSQAFKEIPFSKNLLWPRISVIVCTYNGERTIRDCLEGLSKLEYSNFEVIVINDGSTDGTEDIVREYGFQLISTENRGLSNARNRGLEEATGEIVAYTDDDARPDPHWLTFLASTFKTTKHVAVGGPNIAPQGDGPIADCVANAPGGPNHVLLSDQEAEHIPGCNMAFRKEALQSIGGFDPQFRIAGDDVDVCWRLQEMGWTLGFNSAAFVWHHRRNFVHTYWKQQINYGKAEALLEQKWPAKYNGTGHMTWLGRIYGNGITQMLGGGGRIYQGIWGMAPFQRLYQSTPGLLRSFLLMPEWYLAIVALSGLSVLSFLWPPLVYAVPLLALAVGIPTIQACFSAIRASKNNKFQSRLGRFKFIGLTAFLHLFQPLARLYGRLKSGLTPWRRCTRGFAFPWPKKFAFWTENWKDPAERVRDIEGILKKEGCVVFRGGVFDNWDLEVRGGLFGVSRLLMAIEDHGAGNQFLRFRIWPKISVSALVLIILFTILSMGAGFAQAWVTSAILGSISIMVGLRTFQKCGDSTGAFLRALKEVEKETT